MVKKFHLIFLLVTTVFCISKAQDGSAQKNIAPEIYYSSPKQYTIGGIKVEGIKHYEENLLINLSGLSVGQEIQIPGDEITEAVKKYWKHGLFSDVSIVADSISGSTVFIKIELQERPRLDNIYYHGLKKSEISDLEAKIQMIKGSQVTPNLINNTEKVIKAHFVDKGFTNVVVKVAQKDELNKENSVAVDIYVDKKQKVKVANLIITGNKHLSYNKINSTMKKTNAKGELLNFFRTKKYIKDKYEEDKAALIDKYNELGYRDAVILSDSVVKGKDENTVDVYLSLSEGDKYHIRNISWVGNVKYTTPELQHSLRINKGDVYNQKMLNDRLTNDEDAVSNLYLDNGYLFFRLVPVEVVAENDSIDLEMRIVEGPQATINQVIIEGNTRTNEQVVRRELRTKPGDLFSKAELIRSVRELANLNHFNPEKINPVPKPNPEDGTVDIVYGLEEKPTDQLELSGGWGAGMFVGTIGLSFNNFSLRNILDKSSYSPLPQGDGQSLSIRAQSNGSFYKSFSFSFSDPWLGGKRPNSFSLSVYRSIQTGVSQNSNYSNPYGYGSYGGYGYGGYGSSYGGSQYDYMSFYDPNPDQYNKVWGASVGFGKRLSWPDDYFTLFNELSYQHYNLRNWNMLGFQTGKSTIVSLSTSLSRSSIDNPIFTRKGSSFSLSVQFTPPYSLFSNKDYDGLYAKSIDKTLPSADRDIALQDMYKFIEYHKWKFKAVSYTPLTPNQKLILMARAEYGFLGAYNDKLTSPFEKFTLGGDGMSGYSLYGTETVGLRGYKNNSLTPYNSTGTSYDGNIYNRLTLELHYPIMLETSSTIYALGFLEAGNAWASRKDFNPFNLYRSAGMGLRIFLPMFGMMGIDWGYGFDEVVTSPGSNKSNFHFIIGQQF